MGWIYWWARLASHFPGLANFFTQTRPLSNLMKWMGGIAPERQMPKFATETFREWFEKREKNLGREESEIDQPKRVLLWVDTFTNFFTPEIPKAAVDVLEAAGFRVAISKKILCCGRPLYDFGMLDTARNLLSEILTVWHDEIAAGTPVVGLEPSCIAVFRDELRGMFPMHEDANRLGKKVFTLSEFLQKHAPEFRIPQLAGRKAILHGHCHHKSIMKMGAEHALLKRLGLDFHEVESGCCGMAGSFGFEKEHYDVSVKCGERVLLPAARAAEAETLIIADGFSCREQLLQLTDRKPLHTAQVLQLALQSGTQKPVQTARIPSGKERFPARHRHRSFGETVGAGVGAVAGFFAGVAAFFSRGKHRH
jgi:Fe-S oxidoreductase